MSKIAESIDIIINSGLATSLKKDGYSKKGRTFYYVEADFTRIVNVQSSHWNSDATGDFTLNLGIYSPVIAELLEEKLYTKLPKEYSCPNDLRTRIGSLMPPHFEDKWWHIDEETDLNAVSAEVLDCWLSYGKPWIMVNSNLEEAHKLALEGIQKNQTYPSFRLAVVTRFLLGERDKAQLLLKDCLATNSQMQQRTKEWAERIGIV